MKGNGSGNGHGMIAIKTGSPSPGYVVIRALSKQRHAKHVAVALSKALLNWVNANPQYRVRSAEGTVEDGQTVLLQIWYDDVEKSQ